MRRLLAHDRLPALTIRFGSLLGDRIGDRQLRDDIVDTRNRELASAVKAAFDDALAAG